MKLSYLWLSALVAGLFFPLGFAPIAWPGLTLISLIIWYGLLGKAAFKQSLTSSFYYGVGKYGIGVSWIVVSIKNFSDLPLALACFITFLFISFLSTYEVMAAALFKVVSKHTNHARANPVLFACCISLSEVIRGQLLTGFPWLFTGHIHLYTPLKSFMPIVGTHGLSFLSALIAAWVFEGLFKTQSRSSRNYTYLILALIPFILCAPLERFSWTTPTPESLRVSLLQGNIAHKTKWDPSYLESNVRLYQSLTEQQHQRHLIVWPENALPIPSNYSSDYLTELTKKAQQTHSYLAIGLPGANADVSYSNSIFLLGKHHSRYDKQHLVPFGEYMPFEPLGPFYHWLNLPNANLTKGVHADTLFQVNTFILAPFICFDIAYLDENARNKFKQSHLLLNISDDSWFGQSFAQAQHLQIAQIRSLEAGKPQIYANNTGISALIGANGELLQTIPANKQGVLIGRIHGSVGTTPLIHIGNTVFIAFPFIVLLLFICFIYFKRFFSIKRYPAGV